MPQWTRAAAAYESVGRDDLNTGPDAGAGSVYDEEEDEQRHWLVYISDTKFK